MLCSRFLARQSSGKRGVFLSGERSPLRRGPRFYARTLKWVLDHEYTMLIVTALVIVATAWLYFAVPKGFFPQQDTGQLMGTTEAAQDISFQAMKRNSRRSW